MLFIISILGVLGAAIFGFLGLAHGGAQLERILAIAFIAMAAAGIVGRWARRMGPITPIHVDTRRAAIEVSDMISLLVSLPIIALCIGVFLLTLIPSAFVMLPFLAVWWFGAEHGERVVEPAPAPAPARLPEPAVV